jgi:hypothetical protein
MPILRAGRVAGVGGRRRMWSDVERLNAVKTRIQHGNGVSTPFATADRQTRAGRAAVVSATPGDQSSPLHGALPARHLRLRHGDEPLGAAGRRLRGAHARRVPALPARAGRSRGGQGVSCSSSGHLPATASGQLEPDALAEVRVEHTREPAHRAWRSGNSPMAAGRSAGTIA